MGTISEKKIETALAKARDLGVVEEPFAINDCEIVLRNLRPDEYSAIIRECADFEEVDYIYAYQRHHIARAIQEVNGVDLRDTQFVSVEEVDPSGKPRTVNLELHSYLNDRLLATWSKEAVFTAYRKFGDVVLKAETKSKEGVKFEIPDETPEEKFRRILGELKEVEEDVPPILLDKILDEAGFMRKSTAEEIKLSMERMADLARAQEKTEASVPVETPPVATSPRVVPETDLMQRRQPLNRQPIELPVDPHQQLQQMVERNGGSPTVQPSPVIPPPTSQAVMLSGAALEKAQQRAMLEELPLVETPPVVAKRSQEIAELNEPMVREDPEALRKIIDQPPAAGINPRFRPPPRI